MKLSDQKRPTQAVTFSLREGEDFSIRFQRQCCLIERRLEQYFRDVDEIEKLCKLAKEQLETSKRRITEKYENIRQNAEKELQLILTLRERREKRRRTELENAVVSQGHKKPNGEPRSERTTSGRVCHFYIKIGCAFVIDTLVAYALFKFTQSFF